LQRSRTGSRRRGKKGEQQVEQEYLDQALAGFSGYIAADELYDGPFCVLSLVDNRNFRRLTYRVLDHSPAAKDITRFLGEFKKELDARGLVLAGITTDGSALYPQPIALVFGTVPHQICQFHVIKELTHAVLHAVAKVRKQLAAKLPALPRGRPSKANRRQTARIKRQQQRIADLFEHRHLFVMHHLTPGRRRTLLRVTRGLPQLRALRQIMEQVYGLFDRRCRSDTALEKLAKLRRRVRCFKKVGKTLQRLFSPNLQKALTFLDDKLLPSTSNAVERGNRRHRKMQKSVYRVRTRRSLHRRMALDLLRESQAEGRSQATATLHVARAASG
jgi:Transposase